MACLCGPGAGVCSSGVRVRAGAEAGGDGAAGGCCPPPTTLGPKHQDARARDSRASITAVPGFSAEDDGYFAEEYLGWTEEFEHAEEERDAANAEEAERDAAWEEHEAGWAHQESWDTTPPWETLLGAGAHDRCGQPGIDKQARTAARKGDIAWLWANACEEWGGEGWESGATVLAAMPGDYSGPGATWVAVGGHPDCVRLLVQLGASAGPALVEAIIRCDDAGTALFLAAGAPPPDQQARAHLLRPAPTTLPTPCAQKEPAKNTNQSAAACSS